VFDLIRWVTLGYDLLGSDPLGWDMLCYDAMRQDKRTFKGTHY